MDKLKISAILLAFVSLVSAERKNIIQPRMSNGAPVDTLSRFPHHITIEPIYDSYYQTGPKLCGGSLISQNAILTSMRCVQNSSRLQLHMQRLHLNSTANSYTLIVNNDEKTVFVYPTNSPIDDIAIIKCQVHVVFSKYLNSVAISSTPIDQLQNKLAVLAGFNADMHLPNKSDQLTYSMLKVVPNSHCVNSYPSENFDEYNQMCTISWGYSDNTPCVTDFGSGLISGWPSNPQLIGVYAGSSNDCDYKGPLAYTNVQKYKSWIQSIIQYDN